MKVKVDAEGRVVLPEGLRRRWGLEAGGELLVEGTETGIVLFPLRPDVRKVYLEVTTRCNLACRTCVRNVWGEPLADMTDATFGRVLEGMRELPDLREVLFGGYGEPFAHPRFLDYLAAVKGLGVRVTVSTNGTLLDEERARALVDIGADVLSVSVDGARPEVFADVRRGADLRTVVENVEVLNRIKRERGQTLPRIQLEFVALRRNVDDLPALSDLARRLEANRVLVTHVLPHTPEMAADALYGRDETPSFPLPPGWALNVGGWLLWGIVELPRMNWGAERRCRFVAGKALVVGWDGGVSPCYALSHTYPYYIFGRRKNVTRYVLGNVQQQSLADIWTSGEYVRFRAEVRGFHFPSCVDCPLRDTCDIAESNDGCWGWCPSCADCLWAQDIVRCP
ncbi:MAG: tungsten cofactor oxidoreductase radical SAM maturase [Chloroflexi bacterium]|nr:tungsten cofactor oxidoreductase radical SAM maturase [Chloroflexota bacterium]